MFGNVARLARLNTVGLVATDIKGNYKISKITDIFLTIFYIREPNHRFLCCLMRNHDKVALLFNNYMAAGKT